MEDVKQVIVVRKDLQMRKGKIAAQVAHASMAAVINPDNYKVDGFISDGHYHFEEVISNGRVSDRCLITHMVDDRLKSWLENSFTKICLYVESEEELLSLAEKCKEKNLRSCLIKDSGRTEFKGVPTYTCIAIGPEYTNDINELTGNLKLL